MIKTCLSNRSKFPTRWLPDRSRDSVAMMTMLTETLISMSMADKGLGWAFILGPQML